jgi:hypothetical protein
MTDTSKEAVLKEATEACRDMARWIANSRIKAVRPLWESHMQKAQRAINMINAENDALRKAFDSYSYIGRDGKSVLAKDLEDERDALRAQLQTARDEALEEAANLMRTAAENCRKEFVYPPKTQDQRDYQTGAILHSNAAKAIATLKSTSTEGDA